MRLWFIDWIRAVRGVCVCGCTQWVGSYPILALCTHAMFPALGQRPVMGTFLFLSVTSPRRRGDFFFFLMTVGTVITNGDGVSGRLGASLP